MQLSFPQTLLPVYQGKVKPKFELVWEISETEDFMISVPRLLKLDSKGNLYFVEYTECTIKKFDQNGKFIKSVGRKGKGPGEFKNCKTLIFDEKDNYYIYDAFLRRISKFNSNDKFVKSFKFTHKLNDFHIINSRKIFLHYDMNSQKGDYLYGNHFASITDKNFKVLKKLDNFKIKEMKITDNGVNVITIFYRAEYNIFPLKNGNLFSTNSDDYNTKIYSPEAELLSENKIGDKKEAVSEKDKEKIFAKYKQSRSISLDMLEINDYKPFYNSIFQDTDGFILTEKYKKDGKLWYDVFSPEGKKINEISLPEKYFNKKNVITNKFIITREENEEELPIIRKYKIDF